MSIDNNKKAFLIILDGYGFAPPSSGNAVALAKKPYINQLRTQYPTVLLKAAEEAVGLPKGYQGNSEVGHFTIGSGRIYSTLKDINQSINNQSFFQKKELLNAIQNIKKHHSALHLLGMISDVGVHSHLNHLFALLKLAKTHQLKKVYIHCITDGRDVPEKSAKKYIKKILLKTKKLELGEIVSIVGRYYAMDRDTNWHRTQKSYDLMVFKKGFKEKDPLSAIDNAYQRGDATDYYLNPMVIGKGTEIKNNDSIIFFNYRTDRAKELTQAFTDPKFKKFKIKKLKIHFVCLGPYSKIAPVVFPAPIIKNNLGEIIAKNGLKQLRIAETEKYAHVTFFFNSQIKESYKNEDRILIHSPKVASYAEKPEMSAFEVTKKNLREIKKDKYALIILNFANGDLVGHSGNLKATIKCIEVLNQCLEKIIPLALKKNYRIILAADHGNAEQMKYADGSPCPSHTINPVECTLIAKSFENCQLKKGQGLQDIAPTILELMGIKKPKEMTGASLIS